MYNSASLKNEAVSGATEDSSFDVSEEVEGKKQEEEEDAGAEEEILQKTVIGFVLFFFVGFFRFPETSHHFFCVCSLSLVGCQVEVGQDVFHLRDGWDEVVFFGPGDGRMRRVERIGRSG